MKILLAPDKFKGSLTAQQVCESLSKGLKKAKPTLKIIAKPMADGGDGSLDVLTHYLDLQAITTSVHDPLMRPILATYQMHQQTAYLEMATASGLVLLKKSERNCMETTSYGTGELIADALQKGAKEIYLFIGGSATNDGGIGMANALGYKFLDAQNKPLKPIGKNLTLIHKIDASQLVFNPQDVAVKVICDVTNPLFGKHGAAHVYATQKGASPADILHLDKGLQNISERLIEHGFPDISNIVGAGAAGGVGGGAIAFLKAELVSGIDTFFEITQLEKEIVNCDIVITGEGKLDAQTTQGKVISGICALAKKYQKPVIAVCGTADMEAAQQLGIQEVYTVLDRSISVADAMENAGVKLELIGERIAKAL